MAPQVLLYLSEHPEALAHFDHMPDEMARLPVVMRTRAHLQWITREFGKLEARLELSTPAALPSVSRSPISAAPPPPPTIAASSGMTIDPMAAALTRSDFRAFNDLHLAAEAKRHGRA